MAERSALDLIATAESDHVPGLFMRKALDQMMYVMERADWSTAETRFEPRFATLVARHRTGRFDESLWLEDRGYVHVTVGDGRVGAAVAAHRPEEAAGLMAWLRKTLPALDPVDNHEVPVTFWTYSPHGPRARTRAIAVPGWDEVEANYAATARGALGRLMGQRDFTGGQLILWHGRPGTGKTYALRALAWEWREWAEFHYIIDPDNFFGEHADYLIEVLVHDPDEEPMMLSSPLRVGGDVEPLPPAARDRWEVLLLEDTGELLTTDAKERTGQALSRLLNVVDGLIGQGLRVLVLVTTNEEVRQLHPAVSRPGRCAANVEFVSLDEEEAAEWILQHAPEMAGGVRESSMTLAQLYALAGGYEAAREPVVVGFGS